MCCLKYIPIFCFRPPRIHFAPCYKFLLTLLPFGVFLYLCTKRKAM